MSDYRENIVTTPVNSNVIYSNENPVYNSYYLNFF